METGNLTSTELKDTELLSLHKGLFEKFIKEKISNPKHKKIVLRFYEARINKDNIRLYYNAKIKVFTQALINDDLESIVKYNTFG